MFIQIFTSSVLSKPNEYYLTHTHYLDNVKLETKHLVWQADNKTIADLCNIGFAMKENIEQDNKIGITWKSTKKSDWYRLKHGLNEKTWLEYGNGVRRNVTVYTDNEQLYNDIRTGFIIGNAYETKLFLRILKLKKEFGIGVGFLTEKEITNELREHWIKQYRIEDSKEILERI
jgi:hypothetical protein